ncbi:hypothetical protein SY89_02702 [Halolamina pelagica]|uniref:DUF7845 domain-containing protein n=1 Tax=Halolamina pelagica TaxID=699431 RepID=A0A0P7GD15_9EURY|nr:hypothetical protein [Halolamina pelagica]KPN31945.1 hypothetical protein SY89_02702 [Halolamina pelagica]
MKENDSNPHKRSGNTPESPENREKTPIKVIDYTPRTHGVDVFFQLLDDNELYDALADLQRQHNEKNGYRGRSGHPHHVGDINPSWTPGDEEHHVGFYSSSTGIGHLNENGDFVCYEDQRLRLFENIDNGKAATTAAKCTLTLEPRGPHLVNREKEPFGYPKAVDGQRYTGTYIKAQVSYATDLSESLGWIREYFEHLDNELGTSLMAYWDPIPETLYFSGLERYVRHDLASMGRIISTQRNTARLIHTGNEGEEGTVKEDIRHGEHSIFSVSSTEFEHLGYTAGPRSDSGRLRVKKDKIKTYRAKNADRYSEENYRYHPKTESKALKGKLHASAWSEVVDRLDSILLHHLEMAAIGEDDLVSDDYFRPVDKDGEPEDDETFETREYQAPEGRIASLRKAWEGEDARRKLEGFILHSKTESYRDILNILMFDPAHGGRSVTYEYLQKKTGLSYSAVQRNVTKLTDARILHKLHEGCIFVSWASQTAFERVRDWLRDYFDPKGVLTKIKERAEDRVSARIGRNDEAEEVKQESDEAVVEDEDSDGVDFVDISGGSMLDEDTQAGLDEVFAEAREKMESGEWDDFGSGHAMTDGGPD